MVLLRRRKSSTFYSRKIRPQPSRKRSLFFGVAQTSTSLELVKEYLVVYTSYMVKYESHTTYRRYGANRIPGRALQWAAPNSADLIVPLTYIVPVESPNNAGLMVPPVSIVSVESPNSAGLVLALPSIVPVESLDTAGALFRNSPW